MLDSNRNGNPFIKFNGAANSKLSLAITIENNLIMKAFIMCVCMFFSRASHDWKFTIEYNDLLACHVCLYRCRSAITIIIIIDVGVIVVVVFSPYNVFQFVLRIVKVVMIAFSNHDFQTHNFSVSIKKKVCLQININLPDCKFQKYRNFVYDLFMWMDTVIDAVII